MSSFQAIEDYIIYYIIYHILSNGYMSRVTLPCPMLSVTIFSILQELSYPPLTLIMSAMLSVTAAMVAFFLPETLDHDLPETLIDGETFGKYVYIFYKYIYNIYYVV